MTPKERIRLSLRTSLDADYARRNEATGTLKYKRELHSLYQSAGVAEDADEPASDRQDRLRKEIERQHREDEASDPNLRSQAGGRRYKQRLYDKLKAAGVDLDTDKPGSGGSHSLSGFLTQNGVDGLMAGAVGAGISSAFRNGRLFGEAAEGLLGGVKNAVLGVSGGFLSIGEGLLSLVLSPFGKSGEAFAKLAGSLGKAAQSLMGSVAGIVTKGVGGLVSLTTGLIGGGATIGLAAVGGLLGSVIPGAGTLAGAAAGAGLGAAVTGLLGGLANTIGGFLGGALGLVGSVFQALGDGVSSILGSFQGILGDLVKTGVDASKAAASNSAFGGLSLAGGAQSASLASLLTGSPGGMAAFYKDWSNAAFIGPSKAQAYSVFGVLADDPASLLEAGYKRYTDIAKQFGTGAAGQVEQRVTLQGVFGSLAGPVSQLFAAGGGAVGQVARAARETALSPGEVQQNLKLGIDLDVIDAKLTRLKTRFLADLIPSLTRGLDLFGGWFDRNEGRIEKSLLGVGRFFFADFPMYVRKGLDALFGFGEGLLKQLPAFAQFFNSLYTGFATLGNIIAGIGHTTAGFADGLAAVFDRPGNIARHLSDAKEQFALAFSGGPFDPDKMTGPMSSVMASAPGLLRDLQSMHKQVDGAYTRELGSAYGRGQAFDRTFSNGGQGREKSVVEIHHYSHEDPAALTHWETRIVGKAGREMALALQHGS